jgi:DNA-binding MarR family transcriptional regulator
MDEIRSSLTEQFLRLTVLMRRYQMKMFKESGLTKNPHRGQGRVLAILKMQPEIGQKELGYLLDMSKQALAELLGKLEKSGDITRTPSEKDRRSYIIKLTDAGRETAAGTEDEAADTKEELQFDAGFDCLTDEELTNLGNYLGRMTAELKEKLGNNDEDDYAEFFKRRFFGRLAGHGFGGHDRFDSHHGFGEHCMPDFHHGFEERDISDFNHRFGEHCMPDFHREFEERDMSDFNRGFVERGGSHGLSGFFHRFRRDK